MASKPLGPRVSTEPSPSPQKLELRGKYVVLSPMSRTHISSLYSQVGRPEQSEYWTYMPEGPDPFPRGFDDFEANMLKKIEAEQNGLWFWALIPVNNGNPEASIGGTEGVSRTEDAAGHLALINVNRENRTGEVGHVMFGEAIRGKRAGVEAFYLTLKYMFEILKFRRSEWKCNNLNEPSKRAAQRLGLTFEGVFRQHMISAGRTRDSAWLSMIDAEWPTAKLAFEQWLDDENFNPDGSQKKRLEEYRKALSN